LFDFSYLTAMYLIYKLSLRTSTTFSFTKDCLKFIIAVKKSEIVPLRISVSPIFNILTCGAIPLCNELLTITGVIFPLI